MELFHANKQWAFRPDDERFDSTQALFDATVAYARTAVEVDSVPLVNFRVEAINGDIQLVGKKNVPAKLTNWAAKQLCARLEAPHGYISTLPATLAAQNLNHGLAHRLSKDSDAAVNLLFHNNDGLLLRAMTGERYSRFWNFEIAERLLELELSKGWKPATPDIRAELDPNGIRLPLYASDHDMFAFMMHPDRIIKESGNPDGLKRGLIASNSEVGAGKLRMLRFLYRAMCGNHIIWGAEDVVELSAIHVGTSIHEKFDKWNIEIAKYLDESANVEEAKILHLQTHRIAATKDDLLDALFGKRSQRLTRKVLEAGYDANIPDVDGDPLTPWGIVQGLTRYSQTTPYADDRMVIDTAAGKILDIF